MSNPKQSKENLKHQEKLTNIYLKVSRQCRQVQVLIGSVLGRASTPGLGGFALFFAFGSNLLKTVFGYCKSQQVKLSLSALSLSTMNCCALSLLLGK